MDPRVAFAIRIMAGKCSHNVSVNELARRLNLSPWHFTHLFKAGTSVSPKHYMRDLKMREAQQLLRGTFLSVKEIAARAGFGDRSHFSRDFKKLCGLSPSQFRNRVTSIK